MIRPALLLLTLTITSMMAGCVATPSPDEDGLLAGAQRVLALDFGRKVTGPRVNRLTRLPAALAGELTRPQSTLRISGNRSLATTAKGELRRGSSAGALLSQLWRSESRRRPHPIENVWPSSFDFAQNTANSIETIGSVLGPGRRPLDEIGDYTHRTDHTDDRPELSFWQRLRRRLPF